MNAGDRRRRALVDVGRPLVERRDRGLERQPGHHQRDAGEEQHVVGQVPRRGRGDRRRSSVEPVAPYSSASPYSSVADPTEPMIRYFRPDSSECSRRMCVAHSTYSGIDSSSKPMNSTTRSLRRRRARPCRAPRSAAARSTRPRPPRPPPPTATTAAPPRCRADDEDHRQRQRQVVDRQRAGDDALVVVPLPDRAARRSRRA